MDKDVAIFEKAVNLARDAFNNGYSPVGAVVTNQSGVVVKEASSKRQIGNILHAEYLALRYFQPLQGSRYTLYSTLEPCIMCAGMATVMKFDRIMWLTDDFWGGASRVYNP